MARVPKSAAKVGQKPSVGRAGHSAKSPKKTSAKKVPAPTKKGRPRSDRDGTLKAAPVKRGRPSLKSNEIQGAVVPAKRGRPSIENSENEVAKPAKRAKPSSKHTNVEAPTPAKRGRPSIKTLTAKGNDKAKRGRPAKSDGTQSATKVTKQGIKRARKDDGEEGRSAKRVKTIKPAPVINDAPTQPLDVYVFGSGEAGELGLGSVTRHYKKPCNVRRPRLNDLLDANTVGVVQIAAGGMHCVAITAGQQIYTWGVNDNGALGRDTTWEAPLKNADADSDSEDEETGMNQRESIPTAIPSEAFGDEKQTFVEVVATDNASFALTAQGQVYGWGTFCFSDGVYGFDTANTAKAEKLKAENKPRDDSLRYQRVPKLIPELKKIKLLAAGSNHVLALDDKGKVFAWGSPEQYQLGRPVSDRTKPMSLTPRFGAPRTKISNIACGGYHSFAVDAKGQVYAWGLNNFGQTGVAKGAGEDKAVVEKPTLVETLGDYQIKRIQGGLQHSIACTEEGKVLVWGRCQDGQAGVDLDHVSKKDLIFDAADKPVIVKKPVIVPGINAANIDAGIDDCMVVTKDGKAYAWGYSQGGRTGLGTEENVRIASLINNTAVQGKTLNVVQCGGQFSLLAGPAASYANGVAPGVVGAKGPAANVPTNGT